MKTTSRSGQKAPATAGSVAAAQPQTIPPEAAIEPAIEAAANRAAAERSHDPVDVAGAGTIAANRPVPVADADALGTTEAAVLPEPTLVAEPGAPRPIVTASPVLAAEPTAVDVVKAQDAAAERTLGHVDPLLGEPDPGLATAGQPTLTIEGERAAMGGGEPRSQGGARRSDPAGFDVQGRPYTNLVDRERFDGLHIDDVLADLRDVMRRDPDICARVLDQLLPGGQPVEGIALAMQPAAAGVAVVEVVGPPQGRRRAGRNFGPQPTRFFARDLGDDALAALRADPLLVVGISEVPGGDAFAHVYA